MAISIVGIRIFRCRFVFRCGCWDGLSRNLADSNRRMVEICLLNCRQCFHRKEDLLSIGQWVRMPRLAIDNSIFRVNLLAHLVNEEIRYVHLSRLFTTMCLICMLFTDTANLFKLDLFYWRYIRNYSKLF